MTITYQAIGTIHSPFQTKEGMPIQSNAAQGVKGYVELKDELQPALTDLDDFSHIILIYHFHKSKGFDLLTTPFLDIVKRGVFATRAPKRPNSIGLSVVRLLKIDKNIIQIENVDILDGTPLLDIKPYVSEFDAFKSEKNGWLDNKTSHLNEVKSDKRFG